MAEADAIRKARLLYINKADIMQHGLTEGCIGCRSTAEGMRAPGHSEGCRARLEAELAKSDDGRVRLTTAYLRGLARDGPGAPPAFLGPASSGESQDVPMVDDGSIGCR